MGFRIQDQAAGSLFDSILVCAPRWDVLDEIQKLVDWGALRQLMAPAYSDSGLGRKGNDPVVMLKMLLLEHLFNLSDVRLSLEVADRLTFRRFLGLGAEAAVPDDSTLVKFRERLRENLPGGEQALVEAVLEQLAGRGLEVRRGTITVIDATIVPAAVGPRRRGRKSAKGQPAEALAAVASSQDTAEAENATQPTPPVEPPAASEAQAQPPPPLDPDAAFTRKYGRIHYGYKVHAAVDRATGLVTAFTATPANVHDSQVLPLLIDLLCAANGAHKPQAILADKAYDSMALRKRLAKEDITDGILWSARGGRKLLPQEEESNALLTPLRARIEPVFAALKRWRGLARATGRGLKRLLQQATYAILAHNLLTAVKHLKKQRTAT
jgi:IS5 family transposase